MHWPIHVGLPHRVSAKATRSAAYRAAVVWGRCTAPHARTQLDRIKCGGGYCFSHPCTNAGVAERVSNVRIQCVGPHQQRPCNRCVCMRARSHTHIPSIVSATSGRSCRASCAYTLCPDAVRIHCSDAPDYVTRFVVS